MKRVRGIAFLVLAAGLAPVAQAQIHGTPPSVTSLGGSRTMFGRPGVAASVTSLGPAGFRTGGFCCRPSFGGSVAFGHRRSFNERSGTHRRGFRRRGRGFYYPYAPMIYDAPYEPEVVEVREPLRLERRHSEDDYNNDFEERRERGRREDQAAEKDRPAPPAPAPAEQDPTVLVYRDGHRREVRNYAIVGPTLYDFADRRSRKVPLAELDLVATRQVNEERGVYFYVPGERSTP